MKKNWKPQNPGNFLTLLMLAIPFTYMFLSMQLGVRLSTLNIVFSIPAALLFLLLLKDREQLLRGRVQVRWMLVAALIFFLLTIIGQVLGFQSLLYYWSGLRNYGRYFVFFFACIAFLSSEKRESYMKLFDAIYFVNFVVTLYQFFVLGIKWDYLGGIFGVKVGCSSDTNVLLMIVVTYSVVRYMHQQEKGWMCLLKCIAALVIAALAEIKFFYVEFLAIVVLASLMVKFSRRQMLLLGGSLIGVVAGIFLLITIFPHLAGWFNLKEMIATATEDVGYARTGDLNRLTAIPILWRDFLTNLPQKLFGLGLGNCDCGPVAVMTSPFYNEYYYLNYTLFSSAFVMLETGLVGLLAYIAFFVVVLLAAHSLERSGEADPVYCQMTKILFFMCLVLLLYDCSLRTENGFAMYFAMALAFLKKPEGEASR